MASRQDSAPPYLAHVWRHSPHIVHSRRLGPQALRGFRPMVQESRQGLFFPQMHFWGFQRIRNPGNIFGNMPEENPNATDWGQMYSHQIRRPMIASSKIASIGSAQIEMITKCPAFCHNASGRSERSPGKEIMLISGKPKATAMSPETKIPVLSQNAFSCVFLKGVFLRMRARRFWIISEINPYGHIQPQNTRPRKKAIPRAIIPPRQIERGGIAPIVVEARMACAALAGSAKGTPKRSKAKRLPLMSFQPWAASQGSTQKSVMTEHCEKRRKMLEAVMAPVLFLRPVAAGQDEKRAQSPQLFADTHRRRPRSQHMRWLLPASSLRKG